LWRVKGRCPSQRAVLEGADVHRPTFDPKIKSGLYTLVATCEARRINPFAYLTDVIPRVQDHPKRKLDELLPGPWARAQDGAPA
jgi:hypothetical protein